MVTRYIDRALHLAKYEQVDDGLFCATVPGLRGVVATGSSLEACRDQLSEVIEEWILVRVSKGLSIPAMGSVKVEVRTTG